MPIYLQAARAVIGVALLVSTAAVARADILSNNLINESAGSETASGSDWLTASFGTGASQGSSLSSVVLLMSATPGSSVELDLYSDGLLSPRNLLGTLSATSAYSSSLTETSFANTGITLTANSTYWLVLKTTTGEAEWSWTADNSGSGEGFQGTWGSTSDAGANWYTYTTFPFQMSVSETSATSPTPEPSTFALLGLGAFAGGFSTFHRKTRKEQENA